jgi:tetratricopeptide (TPR) repeat protein
MHEILPELLMSECTYKVTNSPPERDGGDLPSLDAQADSFLDLLAGFERHPPAGRTHIIARYQAWIERNSAASAALYGAWFNLGVELAAAGDKAGAIDAYQRALMLRPGFYPAAINLGTLLETAGQTGSALAVWQQALQPEEARAALLDYRNRLAETCRVAQQGTAKVLLRIGYTAGLEKLPLVFRDADWREIRRDIDPAARPDFVASMTGLCDVTDGTVDAVYSPHTIKHLCPHEVARALQEMRRVLKPAGFVLITLPDLQEVARYVAEGKLEDPLYMSPVGPIAPLDILYGHRRSLAGGHGSLTPRTGFTSATLAAALIKAGFAAAMVQRNPPAFTLTAIAFRNKPDKEQLARAQAQMLPAADHPSVLYRATG